ncbi:hypothetical protein TRIATDRAFT_221149, partial [Trichoderma atroviride IMI 206040]
HCFILIIQVGINSFPLFHLHLISKRRRLQIQGFLLLHSHQACRRQSSVTRCRRLLPLCLAISNRRPSLGHYFNRPFSTEHSLASHHTTRLHPASATS